MSDLLEHILTDDYVSATDLFEARLNAICEQKLYEKKKMIQAEVFGGLTKADIEARRKAGYVKASDVLPDPREYEPEMKPKKKKVTVRRKKKLSESSIDNPIPASAAKWIERRRKEKEQKGDVEKETKTSAPGKVAPKKTPEVKKPILKKPSIKSKYDGDYVGKGNSPSMMYGRLKQKIASHEPAAPGSGVLKATKFAGKTVGKVARSVKDTAFRFINNLAEDSE